MKLSTSIFGALFLFTSTALADVDFFLKPDENRSYRHGSDITFLVDDMPDSDGHRVYANLYRDGGDFVHTIDVWEASTIEDHEDKFEFHWPVNDQLRVGRYFVQIDIDNEDHDDPCRSYTFNVVDSFPDAYEDNLMVPQRAKRSRARLSRSLRDKAGQY